MPKEKYSRKAISKKSIESEKKVEQIPDSFLQEATVSDIVNAMRIVESGGERKPYETKSKDKGLGAFQYSKKTWEDESKRAFGKVLPMTPRNQELVTFNVVSGLVKRGLSPKQIASYWNSGRTNWRGNSGVNEYDVPFDTPTHVLKVSQELLKILKKRKPTLTDHLRSQ